jgi:hypothetical protein
MSRRDRALKGTGYPRRPRGPDLPDIWCFYYCRAYYKAWSSRVTAASKIRKPRDSEPQGCKRERDTHIHTHRERERERESERALLGTTGVQKEDYILGSRRGHNRGGARFQWVPCHIPQTRMECRVVSGSYVQLAVTWARTAVGGRDADRW